jgi:hypothetical protein
MFLTNNPFIENKPDSAFDVYVVHPSNNSLSSKTRQKISKYNQSNEIANGNTIFIPVGFDLYGKLGSETIKLIDSIAVFGSIHKDRKKSYFLNRFYNNLSFIFANENTNIIKSYISKYGEFRIRNPSIPPI